MWHKLDRRHPYRGYVTVDDAFSPQLQVNFIHKWMLIVLLKGVVIPYPRHYML